MLLRGQPARQLHHSAAQQPPTGSVSSCLNFAADGCSVAVSVLLSMKMRRISSSCSTVLCFVTIIAPRLVSKHCLCCFTLSSAWQDRPSSRPHVDTLCWQHSERCLTLCAVMLTTRLYCHRRWRGAVLAGLPRSCALACVTRWTATLPHGFAGMVDGASDGGGAVGAEFMRHTEPVLTVLNTDAPPAGASTRHAGGGSCSWSPRQFAWTPLSVDAVDNRSRSICDMTLRQGYRSSDDAFAAQLHWVCSYRHNCSESHRGGFTPTCMVS